MDEKNIKGRLYYITANRLTGRFGQWYRWIYLPISYNADFDSAMYDYEILQHLDVPRDMTDGEILKMVNEFNKAFYAFQDVKKEFNEYKGEKK